VRETDVRVSKETAGR